MRYGLSDRHVRSARSTHRMTKTVATLAACVLLAVTAAIGGGFKTSQAATSTSVDLALNRPATASSSESTSLTPNFAVDGNLSTRWSSKWSDPQWIAVDLGQSYAISRVKLTWETAYGKAYQIQVSGDATNWTTIYSTTNGTVGINDLGVNGTGRYVRMYGTIRGTVWGYSLRGFEVYGSGGTVSTPTPTNTPLPTATPAGTSTPVPTATATAVSTANLALNRPATASSNESSSLTPNLAVDGNLSTRWSSQWSDPQWIAVDLGQSYAINRVKLTWETAYGKAYQIQVSGDATNWTTIYSTTNGTAGINDLGVSGTGRYVRIYGTVRGTVWGYSLWEFEVYGGSTLSQLPLATATPTSGATATPVPPTPTPTSSTSTNPLPLGASGAWNLKFSDEFNGSSLDTSKWVTCYPWYNPQTGCTNAGNHELQWYLPSGVSVSNGTLKLTAQKQTVTGTNGVTYNYTSGMVSSGPSGATPSKFAYQYGFIEARMNLPAGKGYWPAFWTLPTDTSWPPEVDGVEYWGSNPGQIMMNYHWKDSSGVNQQAPTMFGVDFTSGWHTLGVSWSPTSVVWYVDGVARKTFTDSAAIMAKPMYLILNLAIDGGNPPDGSTVFPGVMQVDYVRAWQQ